MPSTATDAGPSATTTIPRQTKKERSERKRFAWLKRAWRATKLAVSAAGVWMLAKAVGAGNRLRRGGVRIAREARRAWVWGAPYRAWTRNAVVAAGSTAARWIRRIPVGARRVIAWPLRILSSVFSSSVAAVIAVLVFAIVVVGFIVFGIAWAMDRYSEKVHEPLVEATQASAADSPNLDDEVVNYDPEDHTEGYRKQLWVVPEEIHQMTGPRPVLRTDHMGRHIVWEDGQGHYGFTDAADGSGRVIPGTAGIMIELTSPLTGEVIPEVEVLGFPESDGDWATALKVADEQELFDLVMERPGELESRLAKMNDADQLVSLEAVFMILRNARADFKTTSEWFGRYDAMNDFVGAPMRFMGDDPRKSQSLQSKLYVAKRDSGDWEWTWFRSPEFRRGYLAQHQKILARASV